MTFGIGAASGRKEERRGRKGGAKVAEGGVRLKATTEILASPE